MNAPARVVDVMVKLMIVMAKSMVNFMVKAMVKVMVKCSARRSWGRAALLARVLLPLRVNPKLKIQNPKT